VRFPSPKSFLVDRNGKNTPHPGVRRNGKQGLTGSGTWTCVRVRMEEGMGAETRSADRRKKKGGGSFVTNG